MQMTSNTVGQVLFIDDDYSTIAEATASFLKKGFQVQYWNGSGELPRSIYNARIVFLDLDLAKLGMKIGGNAYYAPAINALEKLSGPFIVIILAREFEEEDAITLNGLLKETTGPFCGFVSPDGLRKDELEDDPDCLTALVDSLLIENKILNLIISWEKVFDNAKDNALSEIAENDVETSVRALIKILCKNFGESKAIAREFIDIMTRLVSRKTFATKDFAKLPPLISALAKDQTNGTTTLGEQDFLLYSRLMFYQPAPEEEVMTGDIYKTFDDLKYGIVITPKCDLLQNKTSDVLVCYGFPLKEEYFDKMAYPPHNIDPEIIKLHNDKKPMTEIVEHLKNRYLKNKLPGKIYTLWHFKPRDGVLGICFNFHDVQSIKKDNLKHWTRLARLDSPYVEKMLEQYGNLISRIGTLGINKSPDQLQKIINKIDEERKQAEAAKKKLEKTADSLPVS